MTHSQAGLAADGADRGGVREVVMTAVVRSRVCVGGGGGAVKCSLLNMKRLRSLAGCCCARVHVLLSVVLKNRGSLTLCVCIIVAPNNKMEAMRIAQVNMCIRAGPNVLKEGGQ
jgi:hypothetical protein